MRAIVTLLAIGLSASEHQAPVLSFVHAGMPLLRQCLLSSKAWA
jgi:hypothetical protein